MVVTDNNQKMATGCSAPNKFCYTLACLYLPVALHNWDVSENLWETFGLFVWIFEL